MESVRVKPQKIPSVITWAGLAGYGFFAPFSIAISQAFFGLALAGFILFLVFHPDRRRLVFPPALLLILMAVYVLLRFLSMLTAGTDPLAIKEEWLFLMAIVGAVMFRDIKNLTRVLDIVAAGVILMGGYGIWQHFVGIDLYHGVLLDRMSFGYRAIGNFSTYLTFSGFFAETWIFLVPAAFAAPTRNRKLYYLAASQIGLVCTLFNYSRSTVAALVVGVVVLLLLIGVRSRKWVVMALLLTVAAGTVVSPDLMSRFKTTKRSEFSTLAANSRLAIWRTTSRMIKDYPLLGVGPGNYHQKYIEYRLNRTGKDLSHAHNDILSVAAESGIPCALVFLALWLAVLHYLYWGYRKCPEGFQKGLILGAFIASVVFLGMAQFEAFFADEEVRLMLMFIWGIGLAVLGNMKASERLSEIA